MQRNQTQIYLNSNNPQALFKQTAYHEAGHAVAIHLRNKQLQLPPVFFQINLFGTDCTTTDHCLAKVRGGRLMEHLPHSIAHLPQAEQFAYIAAFEADIINLLIGPLAEAKYVALRDDEVFNQHLVNVPALIAYGGDSDLKIVDDYLHCFIQNLQQRNEKIEQLFIEAYHFIEYPGHWKIIKAVATYIMHCAKTTITCEEIMQVIDLALNTQATPWLMRLKSQSMMPTEAQRSLG